MSKINFFSALSHKSSAPTVAATVQPAKRSKDAWKSDPIVVPGQGKCSQFVTLTRLLRSKDLLQISDPAIRSLVANVAVFDDQSGHWTELPKLTKGQASDLIDALIGLPNVGFSTVTTAQAETVESAPVTPPPAPAARKATKSETIKTPELGIHETETGLRFEVYKTKSGQIRTRMV